MRQTMIVISSDTVVVCIGTKRDCQCQFVPETKCVFFFFFFACKAKTPGILYLVMADCQIVGLNVKES